MRINHSMTFLTGTACKHSVSIDMNLPIKLIRCHRVTHQVSVFYPDTVRISVNLANSRTISVIMWKQDNYVIVNCRETSLPRSEITLKKPLILVVGWCLYTQMYSLWLISLELITILSESMSIELPKYLRSERGGRTLTICTPLSTFWCTRT